MLPMNGDAPSEALIWREARAPRVHKCIELLLRVLNTTSGTSTSLLLAAVALAAHPRSRTPESLYTAVHRVLHARIVGEGLHFVRFALQALGESVRLPPASRHVVSEALCAALPARMQSPSALSLVAIAAHELRDAKYGLRMCQVIAKTLPPHPHDGALAICVGLFVAVPNCVPLNHAVAHRVRAIANHPRVPTPQTDALCAALLPHDALTKTEALSLAHAIRPHVLTRNAAAAALASQFGHAYAALYVRADERDAALRAIKDAPRSNSVAAYVCAALPELADVPSRALVALSIAEKLARCPVLTRQALANVISTSADASAELIQRASSTPTSFVLRSAADMMQFSKAQPITHPHLWSTFAHVLATHVTTQHDEDLARAALHAAAQLIRCVGRVPAALRATTAEKVIQALAPPEDIVRARLLANVIDAAIRGALPAPAVASVARILGAAVSDAAEERPRELCFGLLMRCITTCALDALQVSLDQVAKAIATLDDNTRKQVAPLVRYAVIGADAVRKAELVHWLLQIDKRPARM